MKLLITLLINVKTSHTGTQYVSLIFSVKEMDERYGCTYSEKLCQHSFPSNPSSYYTIRAAKIKDGV
jgi:hypothetical protein